MSPPSTYAPRLSLKRQLLIWLLVPQLVLWSTAFWLSYRMSLSYAQQVIDQSLTQTLHSLARQIKPIGSGLLVDFPRAAQNILEQDPIDKLSYMVSSPPGQFILGNNQLPPPPAHLALMDSKVSFYDASLNGSALRVATLEVNYGEPGAPQRMRVQIAKNAAYTQSIAKSILGDMLVWLALLGLILSVVVIFGVTRGLRPLKTLAASLGEKGEAPLQEIAPLPIAQAPLEVYHLSHALNRLLSNLKHSIELEKRFVNNAAHQLRTPLAGLISQVELAIAENQDPALQARLQKVLSASERSAHLVNQLLSLARAGTSITTRRLDVAALAKQVTLKHMGPAHAAHIDLGYEGPDTLLAMGEPFWLEEALHNLLENAILYAGHHSMVTVQLSPSPSGCALSVVDNGCGVTTEQEAHLFTRFWRASNHGDGAGLGLSIVSEIAQRLGGHATATRLTPRGLQVTLHLRAAGYQGQTNASVH